MSDRLRILHLYPRQLGINGDAGNVTALVKRAEWRGVAVEVLTHDVGDRIPPEADLVHIGSGPVAAQRVVAEDVVRIAQGLQEWREAGVPFVAIAAGWQSLGREYTDIGGKHWGGAGVFDSTCTHRPARTVGEALVRSPDGILAGFENHAAVTIVSGGEPLAAVVRGGGNTPDADPGRRFEGLRMGESVASNLHGPLLAMNPSLTDRLLTAALRRREPDAMLPEARGDGARWLARVDRAAEASREAIAGRLRVRL